jgi:TatD DNase family protein
MHFIDTHTHIYLKEFHDDLGACLERAKGSGVEAFYLPAIDSETHEAMLDIERRYPACKAMMGLHPCSVKENFRNELEQVMEYLKQRTFIAVGEIGLDFYWDTTFTSQQYDAFHYQINLAREHDLPIVIHSRNATDECIAVVEQYPGLKGVFHCFSGDAEQAQRAIATGFYLGIGGVVTFKKSGMDKVVQAVGLSRLVLETDAPYLAPVPYRGKRNEPVYTRIVAEKIAQVLDVELEVVAEVTTKNAKNLFRS